MKIIEKEKNIKIMFFNPQKVFPNYPLDTVKKHVIHNPHDITIINYI